jgi:hypothetical protein
MKISKLVLLGLILGCLSSVALADASFDNQGGNLFSRLYDHSGMYFLTTGSVGSPLTSVNGAGSLNCNPCSGTVNYATGLQSLSLINNAGAYGNTSSLNTVNSTFTIMENGGTVFHGSFTSISWKYVGTCTGTTTCGVTGGYYQWQLTGSVTGTYMGQNISGATVQLTTGKIVGKNAVDPFAPNGSMLIGLSGGNSSFPIVPESSTLILFGTGLVGIALLVRRKHFSGLRT